MFPSEQNSQNSHLQDEGGFLKKQDLCKKQELSKKLKNVGKLKYSLRDFPGGAVVKNLLANAGDKGSSPGPGRSHMLRSD